MAWIGVDLDGTLASDDQPSGFYDPEYIGPPVESMLKRVKDWLAQGIEVRIFTARANDSIACHAVRRWTLKHFGVELPVTATKDYSMIALWDDRAVAVERNTGNFKGYEDRFRRAGGWELQ